MKFAAISLGLVLAACCQGQTVQSSCSAPASVEIQYRGEADQLALRRTWKVNDSFKDSVAINKDFSDFYLAALLAVYNATALPARDTVVDMLKIRAIRYYEMNGLLISVDTGLTWTKNLNDSIIPTGNPEIDGLISKYALIKEPDWFNGFNKHGSIAFKSDHNWNIGALAHKAMNVEGVLLAGPNSSALDGKDILDAVHPTYTELEFVYGWDGTTIPGQCVNGCLWSRVWLFYVYPDCSVEYVSSYGDPIPPSYLTIGLPSMTARAPVLYPNPAGSTLNVRLDGAERELTVEIRDLLGRLVLNEVVKPDSAIDINELPAGVFVVNVKADGVVYSQKLLKQ